MQYPEFFDDTLPKDCDPDDEMQPPHKPTFSLVAANLAINAVSCLRPMSKFLTYVQSRFGRLSWSIPAAISCQRPTRGRSTSPSSTPSSRLSGTGSSTPPIRHRLRATDRSGLHHHRSWRVPGKKTSLLMHGKPSFTSAPPASYSSGLRYLVLKDVVAPVPSTAVMDESDFAGNQ